MAVNVLIPDVIEYSRIYNLEVPINALKYSHEVHYRALQASEELSLETCAMWLLRINTSLSIIWSQYLLKIDQSDLDIYEFMHEVLRNIGSLLEGYLKPFLQELLQQSRIVRRKDSSKETIKKLTFGDVVNELDQLSNYENLFSSHNIRINQWRNIAYHHDARIENGKIVCTLRDKTKRVFTKEEFIHAAKELMNISSGFKLAYYFFLRDNLSKMISLNCLPEIKLRNGQYALNIVSGMASQGFKVIELTEYDQKIKLVIQDITNNEPDNRRIHTTQFVFVLWNNSNKTKSTVVEYWEKDGTPNFRTSASIDLLIRVENEDLSIPAVFELLELEDLRRNVKIQ